ncbi:Protein of unknown function [Gryllus bimaculatus]|nr:Protein of unknown function [Gryllus bimaculatus]
MGAEVRAAGGEKTVLSAIESLVVELVTVLVCQGRKFALLEEKTVLSALMNPLVAEVRRLLEEKTVLSPNESSCGKKFALLEEKTVLSA